MSNRYFQNNGIKILSGLIILCIVVFSIYRYFSFKKEYFDVEIPGLKSSLVNNTNDDTYLNKLDDPEVSFAADKGLDDLFKRAKNTLDLDYLNTDIDSSERYWIKNPIDKNETTCPKPPSIIVNPVVSSVAPPPSVECTGIGKLIYVSGNGEIRTQNANKTIIVMNNDKFPQHPEAIGYVLSGSNVEVGTTIVNYTIGLSISGKHIALYIDLSKPVSRVDKNQFFCFNPPPVDCVVNWGGFDSCSGACGTTGTQTQKATIITKDAYGGKACPVLTNTQQCQMPACPPTGLTVRLGQNCDNFTGWQLNLGLGTWSSNVRDNNYGFPSDASYITVPSGLTAVLNSKTGQTQSVVGPSEFNFCSKGGFNDLVRTIIVSKTDNCNIDIRDELNSSHFGGSTVVQGIAFLPTNNPSDIIVTDYRNSLVYQVNGVGDPNKNRLYSAAIINSLGPSLHFWGVCISKDYTIYVTSNYTNNIYKIGKKSKVTLFCEGGGASELTIGSNGLMYAVTNGALFAINKNGISTQIIPNGIKIWQYNSVRMGPDGNLYILDCNGHKIVKCNTDGSNTSVLAGSPNGESGENDGVGTAARFFYPVGMAMDSNGNMYVGDVAGNLSIRMITPKGIVTTLYKGQAAIGLAISNYDNRLYFTKMGGMVKSISLCHPASPQPLYDITQ